MPSAVSRSARRRSIEGVIEFSEVAFRRRRSLLCRLADGTGAITLRFFHFNRSQQQTLARGQRVRCYGEVRLGPAGLEMVHPEHRAVRADDEAEPQRPADAGVSDDRRPRPAVGTPHRRASARACSSARRSRTTSRRRSPSRSLGGAPWPPLRTALAYLHSPPRDAATALLLSGKHPCSRRIALEELIAQRLSLRRSAASARTERARPLLKSGGAARRVSRRAAF